MGLGAKLKGALSSGDKSPKSNKQLPQLPQTTTAEDNFTPNNANNDYTSHNTFNNSPTAPPGAFPAADDEEQEDVPRSAAASTMPGNLTHEEAVTEAWNASSSSSHHAPQQNSPSPDHYTYGRHQRDIDDDDLGLGRGDEALVSDLSDDDDDDGELHTVHSGHGQQKKKKKNEIKNPYWGDARLSSPSSSAHVPGSRGAGTTSPSTGAAADPLMPGGRHDESAHAFDEQRFDATRRLGSPPAGRNTDSLPHRPYEAVDTTGTYRGSSGGAAGGREQRDNMGSSYLSQRHGNNNADDHARERDRDSGLGSEYGRPPKANEYRSGGGGMMPDDGGVTGHQDQHFGPGHPGARVMHQCQHCGRDNDITRYFRKEAVYRIG